MLKLYQSNRTEYLADLLIEITRQPSSDPFAAETVVVPHAGMGRWLSLQIAERTGVCANYRFPLPAGFIWEMFARLLPGLPNQEHYAPAVMQWSLFALLGKMGSEPLFRQVAHYLAEGGEQGRFELACRLAFCFDQYLVYRPDWIQAWEAGRSATPHDGWQAELWRRLRHSTGTDHWVDLQRRLSGMQSVLPVLAERLPERVSLFALPTLSSGYLALLSQLAEWMDIHLFLLNPCAEYWSGIVQPDERSGRQLIDGTSALYLESGNPLLASLGRQGRDFVAVLLELDPPTIDLFGEPERNTLLAQLQRDILYLQDGTLGERHAVDPDDGSISIHSCHGPMREVEVLRDQLLDLFQQHPDLQPHQVLVMTPDMAQYAPYIDAVFNDDSGSVSIPFAIAERGTASESPLIKAFLQLLDMPSGRYQSSELLSLLEVSAIRRRFSIAEGDLATLHRWVGESGIRWGRDAANRGELGLPETDQNSWRAGLDRMLLGLALPGEERQLFAGVLPYDQIEGSDAQLLSSLYAFTDQLFELPQRLAGIHPLARWSGILNELIFLFFQPDEAEELQLQRLRALLTELLQSAQLAGFDEPVSLTLLHRQLLQQLQSGSGTGGFLGGGVTFCALAPMRSLPFEVICLLGMNDGLFPSNRPPVEFDLMAGHYRLGDRRRRVEDRYLFLEMLISARRALCICYTGQDIRDNSTIPPSVFVSELMDYLDNSCFLADGRELRSQLLFKHHLQPFHPSYFPEHGRLFSYDRNMAAAAHARTQPQHPMAHLLRSPLPQPEGEWRQLGLDQLISFYANPVRYLLRERLGVLIEREEQALDTRDPFELDYFEQDRLGSRLIESALEKGSAVQLLDTERAAGRLPHGRVGERLFQQLGQQVDRLVEGRVNIENYKTKELVTINYCHNDLSIYGVLPAPFEHGLSGYSFKPLSASRQLGLWIAHLARNLPGSAGAPCATRWLSGDGLLTFSSDVNAAALLGELLDLYWKGLSTPLHLFPKSSREYVSQLLKGGESASALDKAWRLWAGGYQGFGEFSNAYYQLAFPLGDVLDEEFQRLSEQVFHPLLTALELT